MRRVCCCGRAAVQPAPAAAPDLVADLPICIGDTSPGMISGDANGQSPAEEKKIIEFLPADSISLAEKPLTEEPKESRTPRTSSIHLEDFSEKSSTSHIGGELENQSAKNSIEFELQSQASSNVDVDKLDSQSAKSQSVKSQVSAPSKSRSHTPESTRIKSRSHTPESTRIKSRSHTPESPRSGNVSPEVIEDVPVERQAEERDVRTALAECIVPSRHEDWEVIVNGLVEMERLAADTSARAPAVSWRSATRSAATHVRSLRSRVARAACSTLGVLFEYRGRCLDTELEEAASALLDRCADVNRFLRGDAANALGQVACGGSCARAGVALARRGAAHRAGPVRAAAAQALGRLVRHNGAARMLELPAEPRALILRAAGELLGDASAETRLHARHLCLTLSEDVRFRHLLKDAMPPSRYRAIEKFVDKLRCR